ASAQRHVHRRDGVPRRRDLPRGILARTGRKGNLLDLSERADPGGHTRWAAPLLRAKRPIRPGGAELYQSRVPRSQPESAGVPYVPGRLRDREEPVGVRAAAEVGIRYKV